ncbi:hypothetical protein PROVALCAL_02041, partial [Providencia alcalifaciens DSM 30120]
TADRPINNAVESTVVLNDIIKIPICPKLNNQIDDIKVIFHVAVLL